jgi:Family of unknown function (DUF6117)
MIRTCGVASATPQFPIFTDEPGHYVFIATGLFIQLPYRALLFWSSAMSIPDYISTNFDTLLRAASDGNLALMECTDAITGEPRYAICAVGREGTDYLFTPFGHLADGNPYDAYLPPAETLPGRSPT